MIIENINWRIGLAIYSSDGDVWIRFKDAFNDFIWNSFHFAIKVAKNIFRYESNIYTQE